MKKLKLLILLSGFILSGCCENDILIDKYIEENCHTECKALNAPSENKVYKWKAGEYLEMRCFQVDNKTGELCKYQI